MKARMSKQIICCLLALILLIGSLPMSAFAIGEDALQNVALGKTVSASSSFNEIYTPDKVVDGNKTDDVGRWNSQMTTDAEWLIIDLEGTYSIESIYLEWWAWGNLARTVVVSVSKDGKSYDCVGKLTDNFQVASNTFELAEKTDARYVRFDLDNCVDVWGYSLSEIEVFGEKSKEAVEYKNVALGKSATASSQYNEWYPPEKLLDGKRTADNERWNSKGTRGEEWVVIDLEEAYEIYYIYIEWLSWGNLAKKIVVSLSDDGTLYEEVDRIEDNFEVATNTFTFDTPINARYVKIEFDECYSDWGYSIWEIEVYSLESEDENEDEIRYKNLALLKNAYASTVYNTVYTADKAVDGDTTLETTRWNSQGTREEEWIEVDLGETYSIFSVYLTGWSDLNLATKVDIYVSVDGTEYKQIYTNNKNKNVDTKVILDESVDARYVKATFSGCVTDWGYSIREIEVYSKDHIADINEAEYVAYEGTVKVERNENASGGYCISGVGFDDNVLVEKLTLSRSLSVRYSAQSDSRLIVYVDNKFATEIELPKTENAGFATVKAGVYIPEGSNLKLVSTRNITLDRIDWHEESFQNETDRIILAKNGIITNANIVDKYAGSYSGDVVGTLYGATIVYDNLPSGEFNTIAIKYVASCDTEIALGVDGKDYVYTTLPASAEFNVIYLRIRENIDSTFTIATDGFMVIDTLELVCGEIPSEAEITFTDTPRNTISLDGVWECTVGDYEDTTVPELFDKTIVVPGMWDLADANLGNDNGKSLWYQKTVNLNEEIPEGQRIVLRINKAYYGRTVYVNGTLVGTYYYNYTASEMDITDFLVPGENKIQIKLGTYESGKADPDNPAHMGYDSEKQQYLPGIVDSVSIIINKDPYVDTVQTAPDLDNGEIRVVTQLKNSSASDITGNVTIRIYELGVYTNGVSATDKLVNTLTVENVTVKSGETFKLDKTVEVTGFDKAKKAWSPDNPYLYRLEIETEGDLQTHRFGMRTFVFDKTSGKTLLNGEVYYLRGTNICINRFYEDAERSDHPWDEEWVRQLFGEYQYVNWEGARFCIGFPPEFWYDICDEIGFLVVDEYPYWRCSEGELHDGCKEEDLTKEYVSWIYERNNHPCVIFWDAQNESDGAYDLPLTAKVIQNVRDIDIQGRAWENGWGPVQNSGDPYEIHYYPFQDANYTNDKIGTGAFTLPASSATKFNYVNEYGWIWVDRNGNPTYLSNGGYSTGNRGTNNDEYKMYYAVTLAQMTERYRASRKYFGVFQFCGLTYSINDGSGYTSDILSADLSSPVIREEHKERLRSAFAPVGIVINDWSTTAISGTNRVVPVILVNDLNENVTKNVTVTLYKNHSESQRTVVSSVTKEISVSAMGVSKAVNFDIQLPDDDGKYTIVASYEIEGENPIFSERYVVLSECENHVYSNDKDTTCNNCGEIRELPKCEKHVYDNDKDADCNNCGEVRELPKCENHVYDDDNDTTCNNCGEVRNVNTPIVTTAAVTTTATPVTSIPGVTTVNDVDDNSGSPAIIIIVIVAVIVIGGAVSFVIIKKKRI